MFSSWSHLQRRVARDAAAHGGDQKDEVGVLACTLGEIPYGMGHRTFALHGGEGVGATRQALADAPFGAEVLVCIPGSAAAMHAVDVTAENKDFIAVEVRDGVRCHATAVDDRSITAHNVVC